VAYRPESGRSPPRAGINSSAQKWWLGRSTNRPCYSPAAVTVTDFYAVTISGSTWTTIKHDDQDRGASENEECRKRGEAHPQWVESGPSVMVLLRVHVPSN
jgi:hypothetical protein